MASKVKDKVFEKKHTKLKAFVVFSVRYAISLALLYGALILFAYNKRVEDPFGFVRLYWLWFLAVAAIGILIQVVKANDVIVTVMSKTVDITAAGKNFVFHVDQFKGPNINANKKKGMRYELVFAGTENKPESAQFIVLPGITAKEFKDICDAIMTAKQELAGDIQYKVFEGKTYERNRKDGADPKFVSRLFLVTGIPVCALVYYLVSVFILNREVWEYIYLLTIALIVYGFVIVGFIRYLIEYGLKPKKLKTLNFSNSGYEINGVFYSYKDIEYITMTPPYLTGFTAFHRALEIKLFDSKKPLIFSLGNRLDKDRDEDDLGQGCTCLYPALYERIKTDKALGRKFQL